jgi:hypothetical protein
MGLRRLLSLGALVALSFAGVCGGAPTTSASIPIALGGKHPDTAKAFIELMLPEYDGTLATVQHHAGIQN